MTKKIRILIAAFLLLTPVSLSYILINYTGMNYKRTDTDDYCLLREVLAPESQLKNFRPSQIIHMEALNFMLENNQRFLQEDRKDFEKWLNSSQGLDKKYLEIMTSIHDSLLRIPQMEIRKETLYSIWSNLLSLSRSINPSDSKMQLISAVKTTVESALQQYAPVVIPSVKPAHSKENLLKELEALRNMPVLETLSTLEEIKSDPYYQFLIRLNDWEQLRKWKSQGFLTKEQENLFSDRRKQVMNFLIHESIQEIAGNDIKMDGKSIDHIKKDLGSTDGVNSDYDVTINSLQAGIKNNRSEVVVKKIYEKFNALMRETAERGPYVFPDTCFDANVYTEPLLFNLQDFGSASNEIMTLETAMSFFAFLQNVGSTDSPAWKKLKTSLTKSLKGKNDELLRNMNLMISIGERRFKAFMDEISLRRPSNYNSLDKYQQKEIDKIIKNNLFVLELEKLSALKEKYQETVKNENERSKYPELLKDLMMQSMIVKSFEDDAYITPGAFIETVVNGQEAKYNTGSESYINLRGKEMSYRQFCSMIENAAKMFKVQEKAKESDDAYKTLANSAKYISRLLQIQYSMNALDDETGNFMMDMHYEDRNIEELVLLIKQHKGQNANIENLILEKMQSTEMDSKTIAAQLLATCEKQFYEGFVSYAAQVNSEIRINKWHKWNSEIENYQKDKPDFKGPDLFNIFSKSVNEYKITDWVGVLMVIYKKLDNHYEQVEKDFVSKEGITMKNTFLAKTLQNKIANIPEMNNTQLSAVLKEIIDYLQQSENQEQQVIGQLNQQFVNQFLAAA